MLMRFGVGNYLSIRDYQELSMVSSALKGGATDLIEIPGHREQLVPAALIYGANASGKSNFLGGLSMMKAHVMHSFSKTAPNTIVPGRAFLLDEEHADRATRFDIDFILSGVRYHYGYTFNRRAFVDEWLYTFPHGSRQMWFSRTNTTEFQFGKNLKGRNKAIEDFTRNNSLFLSAAAQNAHVQLTPIFEYFQHCLQFDLSASVNSSDVRFTRDSEFDPRIIEFLRHADTGIADVIVNAFNPDATSIEQAKQFTAELKSVFAKYSSTLAERLSDGNDDPPYTVRFSHRGDGTKPVPMDIESESRGTLRLLKLLSPILDAIDGEKVLIIDELDASLHTLLAIKIVEMFGSRAINKLGSQLIATTHDTNLLCMDSLRRDQIWFAEKSREGATSIYPLTDIKTRLTDNLEKGYLQGRFGGVPFLGSLDRLLGRKGAGTDNASEA